MRADMAKVIVERPRTGGPPEDTFRRMSPKLAYIKKYDIWYALTLTKLSPELITVEAFGTRAAYKITTAMEDMFLNAHVRLQIPYYNNRCTVTQCGETLRAYGDGWVYASRKRALNSTEIRQAGLR